MCVCVCVLSVGWSVCVSVYESVVIVRLVLGKPTGVTIFLKNLVPVI